MIHNINPTTQAKLSTIKHNLVRPILLPLCEPSLLSDEVKNPHNWNLNIEEEWEQPTSLYGIYNATNRKYLGSCKTRYSPSNTPLIFDSFIESLQNVKSFTPDFDKIKYQEYRDGKAIDISIPLPIKPIKGSPMVGDIMDRELIISLGFDGNKPNTISTRNLRVWCNNGAKSWVKGGEVRLKNTAGNHFKLLSFVDNINTVIDSNETFIERFGQLAQVKCTPEMRKKYLKRITGYSPDDNDYSQRQANIINAYTLAINTESANTGNNMFSFVNGITRHLSHTKTNGNTNNPFNTDSIKKEKLTFEMAFAEL